MTSEIIAFFVSALFMVWVLRRKKRAQRCLPSAVVDRRLGHLGERVCRHPRKMRCDCSTGTVCVSVHE